MSASNVEKFFKKVEGDKSLAAKLKKMAKDKRVSERAAGVVQIAAAAGFKFTAKELAEANAAKRGKLPAGAAADVTGQEDPFCGERVYWGGGADVTGQEDPFCRDQVFC